MQKTTKSQSLNSAVISPAVIDTATEHIFRPKPVNTYPCRICGEPGATDSSEGLCWICRRLKISAWQGSETQDASND